jgi:hypothetical protein
LLLRQGHGWNFLRLNLEIIGPPVVRSTALLPFTMLASGQALRSSRGHGLLKSAASGEAFWCRGHSLLKSLRSGQSLDRRARNLPIWKRES